MSKHKKAKLSRIKISTTIMHNQLEHNLKKLLTTISQEILNYKKSK